MVHYKTVGLKTGEIINGKILQPAILIANRKQRPAGAGRVHGGESMRFLVCVMEGIDPREASVSAWTER